MTRTSMKRTLAAVCGIALALIVAADGVGRPPFDAARAAWYVAPADSAQPDSGSTWSGRAAWYVAPADGERPDGTINAI